MGHAYTFTVTPGYRPGVFVRVPDRSRTCDIRETFGWIMAAPELQDIHLQNQSVLNIAALLKEDVGGTRNVGISWDAFLLDDGLIARDVEADVRLTRLRHHVLATGEAAATVTQECVRCLTEFDQPVEAWFSEQFRQLNDVRSGHGIADHRDLEGDEAPDASDEDVFVIDENHELDFGEALRQHLVLAMPMTPVCGDACPGPDRSGAEADDEPDTHGGHFDELARLLADDRTDRTDNP